MGQQVSPWLEASIEYPFHWKWPNQPLTMVRLSGLYNIEKVTEPEGIVRRLSIGRQTIPPIETKETIQVRFVSLFVLNLLNYFSVWLKRKSWVSLLYSSVFAYVRIQTEEVLIGTCFLLFWNVSFSFEKWTACLQSSSCLQRSSCLQGPSYLRLITSWL